MLAAAAGACWAGGLIWFVHATRLSPEAPPPHTDGIVALTGGAGRVELALHLLATGRADRLLLSGIGGGQTSPLWGASPGSTPRHSRAESPLAGMLPRPRGNGIETAAWAERNHIRSLIVVTAAYHMPRALTEMRQNLPNVHLFPLPVGLGGAPGAAEKGVTFRLEAAEVHQISAYRVWLGRLATAP